MASVSSSGNHMLCFRYANTSVGDLDQIRTGKIKEGLGAGPFSPGQFLVRF